MQALYREPFNPSRDSVGFSASKPRMWRKRNDGEQIAFRRLAVGASLSTPHRSPANEREPTVSHVPRRKGIPRRVAVEEQLPHLFSAILRRKEHPRRLRSHGMVANHVHLAQIGGVRAMGRKQRHVHHSRVAGDPFSNAQARSHSIHDVATRESAGERRRPETGANRFRSRADAQTSVKRPENQ